MPAWALRTNPRRTVTLPQELSEAGPPLSQPQPAAGSGGGSGNKRKAAPAAHWSGVAKGATFTLTVPDVPGPNGNKVGVQVAMQRNKQTGLSESIEPGWTFAAKGAQRSAEPTPPALAPRARLPSPCGRTDVWRKGRQRRRPRAPHHHGGQGSARHQGQGAGQEARARAGQDQHLLFDGAPSKPWLALAAGQRRWSFSMALHFEQKHPGMTMCGRHVELALSNFVCLR